MQRTTFFELAVYHKATLINNLVSRKFRELRRFAGLIRARDPGKNAPTPFSAALNTWITGQAHPVKYSSLLLFRRNLKMMILFQWTFIERTRRYVHTVSLFVHCFHSHFLTKMSVIFSDPTVFAARLYSN